MTVEQYRKSIMSMCYQMHWTFFSDRYQKTCVDYNRLNVWMNQYSYLHKPLKEYTAEDFPKLFQQFKALKEDVVLKQFKIIEED
ncbi:MAG: hypothetical protein COC06_07650 [Bacteroidales bacterium]|nr:MAG: hypothetical protein COC06_07650 [Bacteroidales bacterium]